jgi:5-methylcytosine-specific restriction endonuclease McrA
MPNPTTQYVTSKVLGKRDEESEESDEETYKGYKDQYTSYYGVKWPEIRERVLEQHDYECVSCGMTNDEHKAREDLFPPNGGLHIHHKTPAKEFDDYGGANELSNLEPRCAPCHREVPN